MNQADLKRMQSVAQGILIAPKHKLDFCECCVLSKSKQKPFQNLGEKPTRPKQIFGADVTGPHARSPAGYCFCLEVICFYSGYGYSFPLKTKAETARTFMNLILRLENAESPPDRVQVYVSDHGGETIMSIQFQEFLEYISWDILADGTSWNTEL